MDAQPQSTVHDTLREVFGFPAFRQGQAEVVEKVLAGQSALAVFPTGSGKSLCYQLSALHLEGVTLVVSPLIALMKDQLDFLNRRKIAAARLDSTLDRAELLRIYDELKAGRLKLLYVAPERFGNERFLDRLRRLKIALLVIDEAHCISEWGHNFRPDYLKLAALARTLGIQRVMALTATATPAVAADICRQFEIAPDAYIQTGFYRPNLELHATAVSAAEQFPTLVDRLRLRPRGATIVYVTLQRTAEEVADGLRKAGFESRAYHAGLETAERTQTQDWFMNSPSAIVVATIAFGMGIDKADIRYVYHFNLPKSLENYSQEIGRAGRDGQPGTCEIMACATDITTLENFTFGDTPEPQSLAALVGSILSHRAEFDISTYDLSRKYDVRPLVLNTLLTYMELAGVIEATSPFYNEYQFAPLRPSAEILVRFDPQRAEFLRQIFRSAHKAAKWFSIDLEKTALTLNCTRPRLVAALTYLEEQGDLQLKVTGLRHGFRLKARPADLEQFSSELMEQFLQRERNDVARVVQVVALVEDSGCLVRHLLGHFGETLAADCGHCGRCLGAAPARLERRSRLETAETQRAAILHLRQQQSVALRSARQIARCLCGITSPVAVQSKLTKHALFGALFDLPFGDVLKLAETWIDSSAKPAL